MTQRKRAEKRKKDARRALVILVLATALFIFSVVHFLRVEGFF